MNINKAIKEWESKKRKMGCVNATNFLCKRVKGFFPKRHTYYLSDGTIYQHVVASNGKISIDLAPYSNRPKL